MQNVAQFNNGFNFFGGKKCPRDSREFGPPGPRKTPLKIGPNGSNIAKRGQFLAGGRKCPRGPGFVPGDRNRDKNGAPTPAETVRILLNTPNFPGVPQRCKMGFSGILPGGENIPKNSPKRFSYCEKSGCFCPGVSSVPGGQFLSPEDNFCSRGSKTGQKRIFYTC